MCKPIDLFTKAYLAAALWAEALDDRFSLEDIAQASVQAAQRDCELFQSRNKEALQSAYARYTPSAEYKPEEQAGHDFWLTRNKHGAGFWDREIGDVATVLTDSAHSFNEVTVLVANNLVYIE